MSCGYSQSVRARCGARRIAVVIVSRPPPHPSMIRPARRSEIELIANATGRLRILTDTAHPASAVLANNHAG